MPTVDIVVPLARDAEAAATCVRSVFESSNAMPFDVIVVATPTLARTFAARSDAAPDRVTIVHAQSLDTDTDLVARGVALHGDRDVVVLRPDAEVHGNWLDRLAAHASEPGVGVVATFTDGSGVAIYRVGHGGSGLSPAASAAELDRLFARANRGQSASVRRAESPALYVTRACVAALGGLRGVTASGDANDPASLAARALDAGFDTRVAGDVFVAGQGPIRPTDERERERSDVLRLFAGRVEVARRAASPRPAIVFVAHAWGGGIRRYMDDVAALMRDRVDVLYLEPADATTVKLHSPHETDPFAAWFRLPEDLPVLVADAAGDGCRPPAFPSCARIAAVDPRVCRRRADSLTTARCTTITRSARNIILPTQSGRYCGEPDAAGCARLPWQGVRRNGSSTSARGAQALGDIRAPGARASSRRRTTSPSASVAICLASRSTSGRIRSPRRTLPRIVCAS